MLDPQPTEDPDRSKTTVPTDDSADTVLTPVAPPVYPDDPEDLNEG